MDWVGKGRTEGLFPTDLIYLSTHMVWLKGGAIFVLLSAIFCYSGHLGFLVRLKGGTILCYFLLLSAILGLSATPTHASFVRRPIRLPQCGVIGRGTMGVWG